MTNGRRFKTAFILGAGLGMRLRPLTDHCPKPLLEIGGRPVITYVMDHLIGAGIERFIVNTHYCPDVYREKFPDKSWQGIPIFFRYEPVLLDTAGGLKNIADLLIDDRTIFCYNGDVITDLPLQELIQLHEQRHTEATLALRSNVPPAKSQLLNVDVNATGEICDLRGTLQQPGVQRCLFTGIYAINTSILKHIESGKVESIIDVFLRRIVAKPGSVAGAVINEGRWHDIGSLDEYESLKASKKFPERK